MSFVLRPHPAFSWSHTRDNTFAECATKYYYRYYAASAGRPSYPEATDEERAAHLLKRLTTLHLAAGSAIHDLAKDQVLACRDGTPLLTYPQMSQRVFGVLRHVCQCSKDRVAFLRDPKHPMLHSMWYRGEFDEVEVRAVRSKVERCLYHLEQSDIWRELPWYQPDEIRVIDSLESVTFDGVTLYAAPDLVVVCGDQVVITDWKTGKDDEVVKPQIALYALYTERKLGIPFHEGQWRGRVIWLYDGADETYDLTRLDLMRAESRMRESVELMRQYLEDPESNRPKPRDAFPLAHPQMRWRCPRCEFLQLCAGRLGRGATHPGGAHA